MTQLNAHNYPQIYSDFGIDLRDLGCVMLNTETPVESYPEDAKEFFSPDAKKFWIKGQLDHWHLTLRYGLLKGTKREHVDTILEEVGIPGRLTVVGTEIFKSPYPEERYGCLVARVEDENLFNINNALGLIPNVNTFSEYKAHVTIGYYDLEWLENNRSKFKLKSSVSTLDTDYGHVIV